METTLIILKPDAVQRGLMGRIIAKFEDKGLQIVGAKLQQVPKAQAEQHYAEHEGKPFYPGLIEFITSTPVMVLAVRGPEAIAVCRKLVGKTKGTEAEPGTIRGDFGISPGFNLVARLGQRRVRRARAWPVVQCGRTGELRNQPVAVDLRTIRGVSVRKHTSVQRTRRRLDMAIARRGLLERLQFIGPEGGLVEFDGHHCGFTGGWGDARAVGPSHRCRDFVAGQPLTRIEG